MPSAVSSSTRHVYVVYGLVVLYAFCYQLQAPLEPFLVDSLVGKGSESVAAYGRLQSFFHVVQTVGSLVFGYLLDRFGLRAGLVVNFLACALTYLLLANTSSLTVLYLSKVPGVAMAGFLCAQTAVSQLTPEGSARVAALGRLTTAYTIGGVLGPYSGGLLGAKGDYFLSAKIAVAGSLLAAALSCALPARAGRVEHVGRAEEEKGEAASVLPWRRRAQLVMKYAGFLIVTKLVTSTANSIASSTQSVVLKNELGFAEAELGFFMSCQFAFGGLANGFLLAPLTELLGGSTRAVVGKSVALMAAGYFFQAGLRSPSLGLLDPFPVVTQTYAFVGVAMLLSVFQYGLSTSITAESTQVVPKDMKGTLIGIEHSIFSAARIVTPSVGIHILNSAGASALYVACGTIFATVFGTWHALSETFLSHERKSS